MKPPPSVKLGPHSYRVLRTPRALARAEARESTRLWGAIDYERTEITLDPAMGPSRTREILLHEVLHGVFELAGGYRPDEDGKNEDAVIHRIQGGLLAFIRENPDAVAFLQEN